MKYGPLPESINRLSDESDSDMECREMARAEKCQVALKKHHPSKFATASKSFLLRRRQWCKHYAKKKMKSAWDPEMFRVFYPPYTFKELKEKTTPVITIINLINSFCSCYFWIFISVISNNMHPVLFFQRHEPDLEGPAADDPEWEYIPDYGLDSDSNAEHDDPFHMSEKSFEDDLSHHEGETKSHDNEEDVQSSSDATKEISEDDEDDDNDDDDLPHNKKPRRGGGGGGGRGAGGSGAGTSRSRRDPSTTVSRKLA